MTTDTLNMNKKWNLLDDNVFRYYLLQEKKPFTVYTKSIKTPWKWQTSLQNDIYKIT